jgi:aquaporin Z
VPFLSAALTFFFLVLILGATHSKAPAGFAPIAIGLALSPSTWSASR